MIDLHTHTINSDGTYTVKELLESAEELGINILSITDHDSVKGYYQLKDIELSKVYSGHILPGVEMTCSFEGNSIELLGYGIDIDKIDSWLEENFSSEDKKNLYLDRFKKLLELNVTILTSRQIKLI